MQYEWLWQGLVVSLLFALLIAVGGVVMGILRARGSNVAPPVLYGLVSAASLAVILGALFAGVAAWKAQSARITPANIEAHVKEWAYSFGLSPNKLSKSDAPNTLFALRVTTRSGVNIDVMRLTEIPEYIVLKTTIVTRAEHNAMLERLTPTQMTQLIAELRVEMSRCRMSYTIPRPPTRISLLRHLPITENVTEDAFLQRVNELEADTIVAKDVLFLRLKELTEETNGL